MQDYQAIFSLKENLRIKSDYLVQLDIADATEPTGVVIFLTHPVIV